MEPEDIDLVRQARSGRREAYAGLVRRHHVEVLRLCASLLADASQVEDAAQEVFLKAYRALGRFRGGSSFSTWLYRIATNHCLDVLRRESRNRAESWDELVEREGERLHRLLGPSRPESALEASDLVRRVLAQLSPEYRAVLILRETQGLSYQEIARALDCSLDSVKARLRRARQELEEKLRHFLGPGNV